MRRKITARQLQAFERHLQAEEKSAATLEKYRRDVAAFARFAANETVDKALTVRYKARLASRYAVTSANSMLAAVNAFLRFMEWTDCCVRQFNVQRNTFSSAERELTKAEYLRLINAAGQSGNRRLFLLLQTLCATGMRVSELPFITAEAVRRGEATVTCKNKTRTVFLVRELQKQLLKYMRDEGIVTGCVFITKRGNPMNRCNIWREMKGLCKRAGVSPQKVFPHNLRHLFARIFYGIEKDLVKLADILGHSSINTTRIYTASSGAEHKRRMAHLHLLL